MIPVKSHTATQKSLSCRSDLRQPRLRSPTRAESRRATRPCRLTFSMDQRCSSQYPFKSRECRLLTNLVKAASLEAAAAAAVGCFQRVRLPGAMSLCRSIWQFLFRERAEQTAVESEGKGNADQTPAAIPHQAGGSSLKFHPIAAAFSAVIHVSGNWLPHGDEAAIGIRSQHATLSQPQSTNSCSRVAMAVGKPGPSRAVSRRVGEQGVTRLTEFGQERLKLGDNLSDAIAKGWSAKESQAHAERDTQDHSPVCSGTTCSLISFNRASFSQPGRASAEAVKLFDRLSSTSR